MGAESAHLNEIFKGAPWGQGNWTHGGFKKAPQPGEGIGASRGGAGSGHLTRGGVYCRGSIFFWTPSPSCCALLNQCVVQVSRYRPHHSWLFWICRLFKCHDHSPSCGAIFNPSLLLMPRPCPHRAPLFWVRRLFQCPDLVPTPRCSFETDACSSATPRPPHTGALFWIHPSFRCPEPVPIMRRCFQTYNFFNSQVFFGWPTGSQWASPCVHESGRQFCLHPYRSES